MSIEGKISPGFLSEMEREIKRIMRETDFAACPFRLDENQERYRIFLESFRISGGESSSRYRRARLHEELEETRRFQAAAVKERYIRKNMYRVR